MTAPDRIAVYWTAVDDEVMPSWLMAQTPKSTAFDDDIPKSTRIEYIRADLSDPAAIRDAALKEAAAKCAEHAEAARKKLGASETREEAAAWSLIVTRCDLLEEAILALIGEKK